MVAILRLVRSLGDEMFGVFQKLLGAETAEVVIHLEGVTERVHAYVAVPTALGFGSHGKTAAQGLVMILRNLGIDSDRHVGNGAGQKFLTHEFAAMDRISLCVERVSDEPGGMGQHALAVGNFRRLVRRPVPVVLTVTP